MEDKGSTSMKWVWLSNRGRGKVCLLLPECAKWKLRRETNE